MLIVMEVMLDCLLQATAKMVKEDSRAREL
jgi:hypothetical protein